MQIQSYTSKLNTLKYNYNTNNRSNNRAIYSTPLKNDVVSFGINPMGKLTDGLAYGMGYLGSKRPVQKLVDFLKDKNYQQHLAAFVGIVLSSFYMIDTARSKTIEKDQKMPLIANQATVSALSTVGAYTLDNYLDKHLGVFTEKFNIANISDDKTRKIFTKLYENPEYLNVLKRKAKTDGELQKTFEILDKMFEYNKSVDKQLNVAVKKGTADDVVKSVVEQIKQLPKKLTTEDGQVIDRADKAKEIFMKELKNSEILQKIFNKQSMSNGLKYVSNNDVKLSTLMNGFKTAKSLMVFAMIYRFIAPVIATPIANSISAKIENHKKAAN